jgi:hypothetical protein
MSPTTFLSHLNAVLESPDEASLALFKAECWSMPLWMMGSMQEQPDGQVAMSFDASELQGTHRPVLFAYVNEAQARKHHPDAEFITYPLGVVGLLAQQQALDLAIVEGDEHVALAHEQFLELRDLMMLGTNQVVRNRREDDRFLSGFECFLKQARDYCQRMPDVVRLHLAAIAVGGAPMCAGGVLKASNRKIHLNALQDMFGQQMDPGDRMNFLDSLIPSERKLIEAIEQAEPVYLRQEKQGWWARLISRSRRPQMVVVQIEVLAHEA